VGILGEAAGEAIGRLIESKCEETEEQPKRKQSSEKKPVVKKKEPLIIRQMFVPDPSSTQKASGEEDPEMQYYCQHCSANFWRRRSHEIRCGPERKNSCPRCGRLGSQATLLASLGGSSFADLNCGLSRW
jgi:DNA-directed RNA polymerase subunit RPC12/RpoP